MMCIGGWLTMENFSTGYPASESLMRAELWKVPVGEYAALFRGLDNSELTALGTSFALETCLAREPLRNLRSEG